MKTLLLPVLFAAVLSAFAAPGEPIRLWSGTAPGETRVLPPEGDTTKPTDRLVNGVSIVRLGNVSDPTITIHRPDPARDTGTAVVVAPGGGYNILAWELEGTEVCAWLNSIGVTGVLLKYRVPSRPDRPRHAPALDDAQRAVGLVRHQAEDLGLDPKRIGMLGFSAGAHLAAALAANHGTRTYPKGDEADEASCRPDFLVLVYPGGIVDRERGDALRPEVVPVKGDAPPAIIIMTQDDPVRVEHALAYYTALKQVEVSAELHLYPTGGHGYGLRRSEHLVTTWPDRVADWLGTGGWLTHAP